MTAEEQGEESEIPEYVDLDKVYEAQKTIREAQKFLASLPPLFCDQCGATNPKHGFYPLYHSVTAWRGELVDSPRWVTCNCCHATEKYPCPYCEEEKRTGQEIDVTKEREKT